MLSQADSYLPVRAAPAAQDKAALEATEGFGVTRWLDLVPTLLVIGVGLAFVGAVIVGAAAGLIWLAARLA